MTTVEESAFDPFCGLVLADKYEVQEMLAEGGMGRVYRGVHRLLDRPVAVKFIQPELAAFQPVVDRFLAEARTASRLSHPNVVKVYDFGSTETPHGRALFLVMELLAGIDLATLLEREPSLPLPRVVAVVAQVLAALSEAHELGIVHRDIKPENVVLEPTRRGGEVIKVIDFGVAAATAARRLTMEGQAVGTPDYMAPEQALGKAPTPQTDLYAVGALLFRLLTGRTLFEGTPTEVMTQHLSAPRPDPADWALELGVPIALCEVWARALAVDPAQRYESAKEMFDAMDEATMDVPVPVPSRPDAPPSGADPTSGPPGEAAGRGEPPSSGPRAEPAPSRIEARPVVPRDDPPSSEPAAAPREELRRPGAERSEASARQYRSTEPRRGEGEHEPRGQPRAHRAPGDKGRGKQPIRREESSPAREQVSSPPSDGHRSWTLVERGAALSWAEALVKEPRGVRALVYHGPEGSGRTRALEEIAMICTRVGAEVVRVHARPAPLGEAGFGTARDIIAACGGEAPGDDSSVSGALQRAVMSAVERSTAPRFILMIDGVDLCDRPSRRAIEGLLVSRDDERLLVVASSAEPEPWDTGRTRFQPLDPLSRRAAARLVSDAALPEGHEEISPLHLELIDRWGAREQSALAPAELVERQLAGLPQEMRLPLEVLALAGALALPALARLCDRELSAVSAAATRAIEEGWLIDQGGRLRLAHPLFSRAIVARTSRDALHAIHGRLGELCSAEGDLEVYVHHALRATPDFQAFLAAEQAARRRRDRGDMDGEIALLADAVAAARGQLLTDWEMASSAWLVLGDKLATRLLECARVPEAEAVLLEAIDCCGQREDNGVKRLIDLAAEVAARRGKAEDAARWRERSLAMKPRR